MAKPRGTGTYVTHWMAAGVIFLLVFAAYSNTFDAQWHLDDYPNVVNNPKLHPEEFTLDSLVKTFSSRAHAFGDIYRPVACLTFALNWYFGKEHVAGYHLVNISVHLITAFFLYLTVVNLYLTPGLARHRRHHHHWIGLLAAVLWALNPLQTQAVTYIVQRMAAMAAMFYIIALYLYVKGRISEKRRHQVFCYAGCAVSYVLAVGAKENAVTLPAALMLFEILFFQHLDSAKTRKMIAVAAASFGIMLMVAGVYLVINANEISLLKGYQHRSFTPAQRLLTEPRITIFYLSQLFYPVPQRLSIEHAVDLSTSFFEPWTTVPAMFLVIVLIATGIFLIRRRPIVALALLFYFLNHLVESTVLPLELVFEHRNYLPSLFLFWPVAAGLVQLVAHYQQKSVPMAKMLVVFTVMVVAGLGINTFIRNSVWATEMSLWEDAVKKAPGRARASYNLAKQYAATGRLEAALALYKTALNQEASRPVYTRALALNGIAGVYFRRGDYTRALKYTERALAVRPDFDAARRNLLLILAKLNRWEQIGAQIDLQLKQRKNDKRYLLLKGELLLEQSRPQAALVYLRKALRLDRDDPEIWLNTGKALMQIGEYEQAEWFLRRLKHQSPNDIRVYIYLVEIGLNSPKKAKTARYLDELVPVHHTRFTVQKLNTELQHCFAGIDLRPASRKLICSAVNDKLVKTADDVNRLGSL